MRVGRHWGDTVITAAGADDLAKAVDLPYANKRQYSQMAGTQRKTSPATATRPYGNDT